jgi:hypothetical protein
MPCPAVLQPLRVACAPFWGANRSWIVPVGDAFAAAGGLPGHLLGPTARALDFVVQHDCSAVDALQAFHCDGYSVQAQAAQLAELAKTPLALVYPGAGFIADLLAGAYLAGSSVSRYLCNGTAPTTTTTTKVLQLGTSGGIGAAAFASKEGHNAPMALQGILRTLVEGLDSFAKTGKPPTLAELGPFLLSFFNNKKNAPAPTVGPPLPGWNFNTEKPDGIDQAPTSTGEGVGFGEVAAALGIVGLLFGRS